MRIMTELPMKDRTMRIDKAMMRCSFAGAQSVWDVSLRDIVARVGKTVESTELVLLDVLVSLVLSPTVSSASIAFPFS